MTSVVKASIEQDIRQGRYSEAIERLEECMSKCPEDIEAKMMLGVCRQLIGDEDSCLTIYEDVRLQMEMREAAGEHSSAVSFWQRYRKLVAALLLVGVVPFCGATEGVVTNGLAGAQIVQPPHQKEPSIAGEAPKKVPLRIMDQKNLAEIAKAALTTNDFMLVIRSDFTLVAVAKGVAKGVEPTEEPDQVTAGRYTDARVNAKRNFRQMTAFLAEVLPDDEDDEIDPEDVESLLRVTCMIGADGVLRPASRRALVRSLESKRTKSSAIRRQRGRALAGEDHTRDTSLAYWGADLSIDEKPEVYTMYGGPGFGVSPRPPKRPPRIQSDYGVPWFDF